MTASRDSPGAARLRADETLRRTGTTVMDIVAGESLMSKDELDEAEAVVRAGSETYVTVGRALMAIRDGKGYRLRGYNTFEAYLDGVWDMRRRQGYRLISAAQVVLDGNFVSARTQNDALPTVTQARILASLPIEERAPLIEQGVLELPTRDLSTVVRAGRAELTERRDREKPQRRLPAPTAVVDSGARPARATILVGDVRAALAGLPRDSVHVAISSPPYYGLRSYGSPEQVWGGDPVHAHEWGEVIRSPWANGVPGPSANHPKNGVASHWTPKVAGAFCGCGAWLGHLGLEPSPDCLAWARSEPPCSQCYVCHMRTVLAAVWPVLREDGAFWLNLGDSYSGSGKGPTGWSGTGDQIRRQGNLADKSRSNRGPMKYNPLGGISPAGIRRKNLLLMPERVALAAQADGWIARSRIPWLKRNCLSGGARVYVRCQKGDMPMTVKEMARLDPKTCKLWNGERWTQVVSVWEAKQDEGDPIEIELRSGERIGCTPEHRWPAERGLLPAFELRVGDVLKGAWLPTPDFEETHRPAGLNDADVGWFVGLYIAEGSMSNGTIQIAGHTKETERFERLQRIAAAFDGTCRAHLKTGYSMTINLTGPVLRGILEQYVAGRTAKDKHLTNRCWMRSNEFLRALLDGYLSGDGHWDEKNQRWRLAFTRNYAWEVDLRTIAARLNIDLRLKLATMPYAGKDVGIFRGSIRFERGSKLWAKNEREIVRLGHSRGRKFWDIAVEDDPHTFALASGVFTHNSMPESTTDRPSSAVEYVLVLARSERYFWDAEAIHVGASDNTHSRGSGLGPKQQATAFGEGIRNNNDMGAAIHGYVPNRNRRNSDWFFESWQGLLLDDDGDPEALVVNPAPFPGAHFATFSSKLVEPMIRASTSERGVCPECGAPWVRVIGRQCPECGAQRPPNAHSCPSCGHVNKDWLSARGISTALAADDPSQAGRSAPRKLGESRKQVSVPADLWQTTGWQPSCTHGWHADATHEGGGLPPVPATVLDPFAGAGSTLLAAARLSRDSIGIELSRPYADMARDRIQADGGFTVDVELREVPG